MDAVRAAGSTMTWDATGAGLLDAYDAAMAMPASEHLRLEDAELAAEARYWHFRHAIGPTGLALVEPDQQLLPDEIQRTLAALARRPSSRRTLFAGLRGLRRLTLRGEAPPAPPAEPVNEDETDDALERLFPDEPARY
jgi:hypothetical protein